MEVFIVEFDRCDEGKISYFRFGILKLGFEFLEFIFFV